MSIVEMLGAKLSSSVGSQKRNPNHQPLMAIVEMLGAKLSLSVGSQRNENRGRWVEMLGTKPTTPKQHQRAAGAVQPAVDRHDLVVMDRRDLVAMCEGAQSIPTMTVTS